MTLFEECLLALKNKATALTDEESAKIEVILQNLFPFISANINWNKIENKITVNSANPDIISDLKKILNALLDEYIYLIWDAHVPVLKTNLYTAIAHFDKITSVRTWFLNIKQGYVLEWHWCGTKVIGLASEEKIRQANLLKECLDKLTSLKFISNGKSKELHKLLSRFVQPQYWNISDANYVSSSTEIIPCIEKKLKKLIQAMRFSYCGIIAIFQSCKQI